MPPEDSGSCEPVLDPSDHPKQPIEGGSVASSLSSASILTQQHPDISQLANTKSDAHPLSNPSVDEDESRDPTVDLSYLKPDPPGTVFVTFFTAKTLAQSDTARKTIVKCYPSRAFGPDDDPIAFAHPTIASVIGASSTFGKVFDPRVTEFSYNMADVQFDQRCAHALMLDFTRWLDNPDPNSRKLTPVPAHLSVVTLTATVVGHDGLANDVSLPPLRLSFEPMDGADNDSNKEEESLDVVAASGPSVPAAPFPLIREKPSGTMPHYYVVIAADGTTRGALTFI